MIARKEITPFAPTVRMFDALPNRKPPLLGGRIALFLSTVWLRRIFIAAVLGLAIKLLLPLH